MNRINPLRRFPMTFAALALLVSPFGCGSETHTTPVAETPAMPATLAPDDTSGRAYTARGIQVKRGVDYQPERDRAVLAVAVAVDRLAADDLRQ